MPRKDKPPVDETLSAFLTLLKNIPTRQEFVESFGNVVKRAKAFEAALTRDFSALRDTIQALVSKVQTATEAKLAEVDSKVTARLAEIPSVDALKGARGEKGADGIDAPAPTAEELTALITPLIPAPLQGSPDFAEDVRNKLELLTGDERLKIEAIANLRDELDKLEGKITKAGSTTGWGAHPLAVQQSGSTKVKLARVINFTGATVTHSPQGVTTVAVTGGGGSITVETPSGTVDDSNVTFTVANTPKYVVVNGAHLFAGAGYSLASLTITLDNPVGTGGFIRSIY